MTDTHSLTHSDKATLWIIELLTSQLKIICLPCLPGKVPPPWFPSVLAPLCLVPDVTPPISLLLSGLGAHCLSDTRPQHKQWVCRVLSHWPRASRVLPRAQLPTGRRLFRSGPRSISSTGSFPLRQHLNEECPPMCR